MWLTLETLLALRYAVEGNGPVIHAGTRPSGEPQSTIGPRPTDNPGMTSERAPDPHGESRIQSLKSKIPGLPDELLLVDELTDQLNRTRQLLTGSPEEAAERALARIGGETEIETRIAVELAVREPLAQPDRFPEAHRLVMRALEVLDREGFRNPTLPRLGPLEPVAEFAVEFVTEYIVKSYAEGIVGRLRSLYARREVQSAPGTTERRVLAGARVEIDRIAAGFAGGGIGAPALLVAGAAVPVLASASQYLGAIDVTAKPVLIGGIALAFVVFLSIAWVLLRGAAIAHSRSQLIMQQPLAALWETIGHAGNPPEDDSVTFATIALMLTTLVWFVLPGAGMVVFYLL
jgi:hypothetical protein